MNDQSGHSSGEDGKPADSLTPYREASRRLGAGFSATLWASPRTQALRFDVLIDLIGVDRIEGRTLLDLGCGDGALAARLQQRSVQLSRYIGIDGIFAQVEAAQRRGLERASFVCEDLQETAGGLGRFGAELAVISGTLNTMAQSEAQALVQQTFEAVSGAICFNFLSDRAVPERLEADLGPAIRHDVVGWLDFALALSPLVSFRQDHLEGHDAAILICHRT
ncbi:MAG: hypothetical protein CBC35_01855 [Planctomycetes bacterium TMED75]|nr:hypothetical protein [Planctomycetaceae bacterium]OUU96061.1 MAG: hypothetical protein CBC35_01855 [Planctomycetes bacterium TMED75]